MQFTIELFVEFDDGDGYIYEGCDDSFTGSLRDCMDWFNDINDGRGYYKVRMHGDGYEKEMSYEDFVTLYYNYSAPRLWDYYHSEYDEICDAYPCPIKLIPAGALFNVADHRFQGFNMVEDRDEDPAGWMEDSDLDNYWEPGYTMQSVGL